MNESLLAALRAEALPCAVNEPLARHTTFRIGGPADGFCQPETVPQLARTLEERRRSGEQMIEQVTRYFPVTPEHILRYAAASNSIYKVHIMQALLDLGYEIGRAHV